MAAGATDSRTSGTATHARTSAASGWLPGRPCPLGTIATADGPAAMPAVCHSPVPRSARNAASIDRSRPAAAAVSARSDLYRHRSVASGPPRTA